MRNIVGLVAVLGLVSGLVGAFAYDQLGGSDAGAAPSAQQVREQNLDGSGIRTHERGTANVNVTNGSLPVSGNVDSTVSGTVNVGNFPAAPQGRLIDATPMTPVGSGFYESPLVGIADCRTVSVLVQGGAATNTRISHRMARHESQPCSAERSVAKM